MMPASDLKCPVCGLVMRRRTSQGLVARVCPEHGVWCGRATARALTKQEEPGMESDEALVWGYFMGKLF